MQNKIGKEFDGVISGVTERGIYVEIIENKCEGMIRLKDMKGDFYIYNIDNHSIFGRNTQTNLSAWRYAENKGTQGKR